jgi:cephalosporin hydroxylase
MNELFYHTKYCRDIKVLSEFLKKLKPDELITVTEKHGYTVIFKSNEKYDWR